MHSRDEESSAYAANVDAALKHAAAMESNVIKIACATVLIIVVCSVWGIVFTEEMHRAHSEYVTARGMWRMCQMKLSDVNVQRTSIDMHEKSLCGSAYGLTLHNPYTTAFINTVHRILGFIVPASVGGAASGLFAAMFLRTIENVIVSAAVCLFLAYIAASYCASRYRDASKEDQMRQMHTQQTRLPVAIENRTGKVYLFDTDDGIRTRAQRLALPSIEEDYGD
jgi:hypothetical protein